MRRRALRRPILKTVYWRRLVCVSEPCRPSMGVRVAAFIYLFWSAGGGQTLIGCGSGRGVGCRKVGCGVDLPGRRQVNSAVTHHVRA